MHNGLVSIIIPFYNSRDHLNEAINSAINQTWPFKEIILIDDGSTDDSLLIAKRYEGEFIKVFHQSNKGASAARNLGLTKAQGDYIQFLDSDDLLHPKKIQQQLELLEENPQNLAIGPIVYFEDGTDPSSLSIQHEWYQNGSTDPVDFLIKLYGGPLIGERYGGIVTIHSWLTPRQVIDKAGWWNENLSVDDDGEFFCRVVLNSQGIVYSSGAINYYRKHKKGDSLSSQRSLRHLESLLKSWLLKKQFLKRYKHPLIDLVIRRNFTELYYYFYNYDKRLRTKSLEIANHYGGLTHRPFFGNRILNLSQMIIGYKTCFFIQKIRLNLSK